jgi:GDP-D-mannose 3',5'-epimerase
MSVKRALVCGAGGFIGSHLVKSLVHDGYWVRGVDLKYPEFSTTTADDFVIADLRERESWQRILDVHFDEASSACMYPAYNQEDPTNPKCGESTAYPAAPDSEYGWEKLFSERVYFAFSRNHGLDVRVARFHNIFGPEGTWQGGREKAPAALCRKVAEQTDGGKIEIWGDGEQTRSFLYIDECVEAVRRLMNSTFPGPVNIGSEEMVTINQMAKMIMGIAGKKLGIKHVSGPTGVRGRNSDNMLIRAELGWEPTMRLQQGLARTYTWIEGQVRSARPVLQHAV